MKPQYLKLINGREVRILWNMNALGNFSALTGKEMTDLVKADVNTLRTVAWCSALEGEAAEGRELGLDEVQFGRLVDMAGIVKFSEIISEQANGAQKKSPVTGNSHLHFFRRRV